MISIVVVSGIDKIVGVRLINEVSYLCLLILVLDLILVVVDFGFNIEESCPCILSPSALAAVLLQVG